MAIYVDSKNGNDSTGTGTPTNPFATLNAGVTAAGSGGTVVFSGFFQEIISNPPISITLTGYGPDQSIWDGTFSGGQPMIQYPSDSTNCGISNCSCVNFGLAGNEAWIELQQPTALKSMSFSNIRFVNVAQAAKVVGNYTTTWTGCTFDSFVDAIQFDGGDTTKDSPATISGCTFINPESTLSRCLNNTLTPTSGPTMNASNCIFPACIAMDVSSASWLHTGNYNSYDFIGGARVEHGASIYTDIITWKINSGGDTNSIDAQANTADNSVGLYGIAESSDLAFASSSSGPLGANELSVGLSQSISSNKGVSWDISSHNLANPGNPWQTTNISQDPSGIMSMRLVSQDSPGVIITPVFSFTDPVKLKRIRPSGDYNLSFAGGKMMGVDSDNTVESNPLRNPLDVQYRSTNDITAFAYNESTGVLPFVNEDTGEVINSGNGVTARHIQLRFVIRTDIK